MSYPSLLYSFKNLGKKMTKFIIIFLIMTSMLFAGDSYMEQTTIYDLVVLFSIIFLLMLIPLYIIVALITKGRNSSSIFVKLFFIDIVIIIISMILSSIDGYKKRNYIEHYNSYHAFQELKEHYGKDILVPGTEGLTILDIHTRMNLYTSKNDVAIYFLANDNTIYRSFFDRTEPVVKVMELNNTRGFLFYSLSEDEKMIYNNNTIVVYDNNNTVASYSLSYKNNKFIFDNSATERINRKLHLAKTKRKRDSILSYSPYIEMRPKIIKNRQELQFADATPFKVKYKPKSALKIFDTGYSGDKDDSLYVVYENKKGLYRLRNMANPENKQVQQKVKFLIEKAIVPKWRVPHTIFGVLYDKLTDYRSKKWIMPDVSSLNINQEKFDKLRILLLENPAIEYNYKLRVYNNHATVVVTSKEREDLRLLFRLTKEEDWKVDDFFISNIEIVEGKK